MRGIHVSTVSKILQQAPASLDGTDRAILAALMEDGRMTNAALAARIGVAESTCAYRVRALRESGVIASINARVDLPSVGRPIQAVIQVQLSSHSRVHINELLDRLVTLPGALRVVHLGVMPVPDMPTATPELEAMVPSLWRTLPSPLSRNAPLSPSM